MNLIGNILWIFLGGGIFLFIEYIIGGIFLCLTIIGIPFGIQKFKLAILSLAPFGQQVVETESASGCLSVILNIVWIFTGGIWIALTHVIFALLLTIIIIGIPFARQHMKLATLALTPFGKTLR